MFMFTEVYYSLATHYHSQVSQLAVQDRHNQCNHIAF